MTTPQQMLEFWFEDWDDEREPSDSDVLPARWFQKDPALDAYLRDEFGALHLSAAAGELDAEAESNVDIAVARILLLDQIPRNIYRGTPHMFATDLLARNGSHALVDHLDELPPVQVVFVLMPFMHSEDLAEQDECVRRFQDLADRTAALKRSAVYQANVDYAVQHRDIIARWGRFPHRNEVLGRPTTPEESEFLAGPGSSF